jgi:hypothetical protein
MAVAAVTSAAAAAAAAAADADAADADAPDPASGTGLVGLSLAGRALSVTAFGNSTVRLPTVAPIVGWLPSRNLSFTFPAGNVHVAPLNTTIFDVPVVTLGAAEGFTPDVMANARMVVIKWLAKSLFPFPSSVACPEELPATCCVFRQSFGVSLCAYPYPQSYPIRIAADGYAPTYVDFGNYFPTVEAVLLQGVHFGPTTSVLNVTAGMVLQTNGYPPFNGTCTTPCDWPLSFYYGPGGPAAGSQPADAPDYVATAFF